MVHGLAGSAMVSVGRDCCLVMDLRSTVCVLGACGDLGEAAAVMLVMQLSLMLCLGPASPAEAPLWILKVVFGLLHGETKGVYWAARTCSFLCISRVIQPGALADSANAESVTYDHQATQRPPAPDHAWPTMQALTSSSP